MQLSNSDEERAFERTHHLVRVVFYEISLLTTAALAALHVGSWVGLTKYSAV